MNEFEKSMEQIFDIDITAEEPEVIKQEKGDLKNKEDPQEDYEYTRGQLYTLISKGQEAVQGALEVAQESGHPRAYEVAVAAMKHVADMSDKLIDLQKKMKDLDAPVKGNGPTTVNNTMFVGSTADLQKMIKEMGKGSLEDK
jgi:hypothetical protein